MAAKGKGKIGGTLGSIPVRAHSLRSFRPDGSGDSFPLLVLTGGCPEGRSFRPVSCWGTFVFGGWFGRNERSE